MLIVIYSSFSTPECNIRYGILPHCWIQWRSTAQHSSPSEALPLFLGACDMIRVPASLLLLGAKKDYGKLH